jgi:AAA+ superfamily predicted ATPase
MAIRYLLDEHLNPAYRFQLVRCEPKMPFYANCAVNIFIRREFFYLELVALPSS